MPSSMESLGAVLRVVVLVVESSIVFIKIAPVVIRPVLLLPEEFLADSVVVGLWEMLVSVATVVSSGESVVGTVTAGMLLGELSAANVAGLGLFVLVFRSAICKAEMAGVPVLEVTGAVAVLLPGKLAFFLGAFGVVSKAVGVKFINGAPSTDERI